MLQHSDKLDKIGAALLSVQIAVSGVEKNAANPHFKSKYADLAATNEATRDHLTGHGIVVTQWPGRYDGEQRTMEMTTMLLHAESGQWMRETLSIPLQKVDAQGYGSCNTYARRYALQAALNLSPEDDDGNAPSKPAARQDSGPVSDEQLEKLQHEADATGANLQAFCQLFKINSLKDMPASRFNEAMSAFAAKRKKMAKTEEREAA